MEIPGRRLGVMLGTDIKDNQKEVEAAAIRQMSVCTCEYLKKQQRQ